MKIIEHDDKVLIFQALVRWSADCDKDLREITRLADKGRQLSPEIVDIIRNNAKRIENFLEKFKNLFLQNYVVCLNDDEYDDFLDSFPIGD